MNNLGDKEPILIVTDQRGFVISAGRPDCLTKKEAFDYARAGFTMKTMTIGQYRKKKWKWLFDKTPISPQSTSCLPTKTISPNRQ